MVGFNCRCSEPDPIPYDNAEGHKIFLCNKCDSIIQEEKIGIIQIIFIRIDLTEPCAIKCARCPTILSRGDSAMMGNGKAICMDCWDKLPKNIKIP